MPSLRPDPQPITAQDGGSTTFSAIHPDVISTNILTRLDGASLTSAASTSSLFRSLVTEQNLWRHICSTTWPSSNDTLVQELISTFPAGHRSFFSDSFPLLNASPETRRRSNSISTHTSHIPEFISAVDIYYKNNPTLAKVQVMETTTPWFRTTPFRVDLLDSKLSAFTPIHHPMRGGEDAWCKNLEENLSLSWIVIEPTTKRAANLSSWRPVSVQRHWLTGEVQVRYATILSGDVSGSKEAVLCGMMVTCGGNEGGEVQVREVSMVMEDMEGRGLSGEESSVILRNAIETRERRKGKREEGKLKYEKYLEKKREWREKKDRRERLMDLVFIAIGVSLFMGFWGYVIFR